MMFSIDSQLVKLHTSMKEVTFQYEWLIENFQQNLQFHKNDCDPPLSTSFFTNGNQQNWITEISLENKFSVTYNIILTLVLNKNLGGLPLKIKWSVSKERFSCQSEDAIVNTSSRLTLNLYLTRPRDKNMTLIFTLTFYEEFTEQFGIHKSLSHNQIIIDLKNYFKSKTNSDITFIVGDVKLKAHKFILMSRCSVFSRMFETDMIEKQTNEVKIDDARPEIFNKMLEFLYTNEIGTELSDQDVEDLLAVAEKYQLEHLKEVCEEIFFNRTTKDNALKIHSLAKLYSMQELLTAVSSFIKIYGVIETPNSVTS